MRRLERVYRAAALLSGGVPIRVLLRDGLGPQRLRAESKLRLWPELIADLVPTATTESTSIRCLQELRYTARTLRKAPGFAAAIFDAFTNRTLLDLTI